MPSRFKFLPPFIRFAPFYAGSWRAVVSVAERSCFDVVVCDAGVGCIATALVGKGSAT